MPFNGVWWGQLAALARFRINIKFFFVLCKSGYAVMKWVWSLLPPGYSERWQ